MRRNCNLKLQLQPPPLQPSDLGSPRHLFHQRQPLMEDSPEKQQQQLTIFYNGRVCVCHVDESQARAIITLASSDETIGGSPAAGGNKNTRSDQGEEDTGISPLPSRHRTIPARFRKSNPSPSPSLSPSPSPSASPTTALSMKRSLQRFLQERRHRILATAPYHVR